MAHMPRGTSHDYSAAVYCTRTPFVISSFITWVLMGLSLQCLARCSAYFSWPYLALSLLLCF